MTGSMCVAPLTPRVYRVARGENTTDWWKRAGSGGGYSQPEQLHRDEKGAHAAMSIRRTRRAVLSMRLKAPWSSGRPGRPSGTPPGGHPPWPAVRVCDRRRDTMREPTTGRRRALGFASRDSGDLLLRHANQVGRQRASRARPATDQDHKGLRDTLRRRRDQLIRRAAGRAESTSSRRHVRYDACPGAMSVPHGRPQ